MKRKTGVGATEDGHEVVLECLDGFLCSVLSVVMRGHKLVCHLVCFDYFLELVGAFVVEDVFLGEYTGVVQSLDEV